MNDKDKRDPGFSSSLSEEATGEDYAEEVLACQDETGMDLEEAVSVAADESDTEDERELADEMLSAADSGDLTVEEAEEIVAQEGPDEVQSGAETESSSTTRNSTGQEAA